MDDEESSSALVRKLTLQADYYAAVSPGLARFYMYEVESVKANLGRRETRVSQLCQYCCTIWRPAHDHVTSSVTVTMRRRKVVSKAMKRLCKKQTQQMNPTEKKIFDKWMQSSRIQRLLCSVCRKETRIPYQSNDVRVKKKRRSDNKQISHLISTSTTLTSKSRVSEVKKPTAVINSSLDKKKIKKKKKKSAECDSLNISSINATPCISNGGATPGSSKGGATPCSSKGGGTPGSSKGGATPGSKGGATPGSKGGATPCSSKGGATPGSSKGGGKSEKKKKFSMLQTVLTREEKSRQTNKSSTNSLNLFLSSL